MTRLRDDQTGGEGRGVRIPVGIGAGFCGYPCGDICDGTATTTRRRRCDDDATTMRRDDDATRRCGCGGGAGESLQPSGALTVAASQSLQVRSRCSPHGAPHSRFQPPSLCSSSRDPRGMVSGRSGRGDDDAQRRRGAATTMRRRRGDRAATNTR